MFKISDLKTVFPKAEFIACSSDVNILSVEHDTRRISANSLYVAIKGENLDGHAFVIDAKNKGAVACICEHRIDGVDIAQIVVKDSVRAYGELAKYWRSKIRGHVIALTGSNGKTTTKDLIYTVLSKNFRTVRTQGNFNNLIGVPYTILSFPLDAECAIVEMGMNAKGEIAELSNIADPDIALITNIGRAHIGRLGSIDAITSAKTELFDHVIRKKEGSFCINIEDERINDWLNINAPKKYITYGYASSDADECGAQVCVKALSAVSNSIKFKVYCSKTAEEVEGAVSVTGLHNLNNVAAAISVGVFLGLSAKNCVDALKDFVPPSMRSNIMEKDGVTYIVDCYNANPDSMLASIRSLSMVKEAKRKVAVIGDMFELDGMEESLHKEVGKVLAESSFDLVFAIGKYSNNYKEGFNTINNSSGKITVYSNEQMDVLKNDLRNLLKKGDHVLVKASRASKLEAVLDK